MVVVGALATAIGLALASALPVGAANRSTTGSGSNAPGVTATSIKVGAISTLTGPIASNFLAMVPGEEAYFDMVDAHGGVNGRKIDLAWNLDDGGSPTTFSQLAHTLVNQDHAFAVAGVATAFFTPSYFVSTKIPTYGYDVTGNWSPAPNLFAAGGSYICYTCIDPAFNYLAQQEKAKSIAVLAYGISASSEPCEIAAAAFKKDGLTVGYTDYSVQYPGTAISSDVQRMAQAKTNFVLSCMDVTGNVNLARAIQQYGLKTTQLWLNGNDQSTLNADQSLMQGVYFNIQHVPFAAPTKYYPGLKEYLSAMHQYEPNFEYNELAIQGWQNAALLVEGIKDAGSNLTQANLIRVTNKITDFTADGLTTPVNWESSHSRSTYPNCSAFIKVEGDKFVPVLGKGHQVFVCFNASVKNPMPVPAPAGTP
jgi:ABC-type branched-subunit amino acid transport system substrate-binding protein